MKRFIQYLQHRLTERSSWVGVAAAVTAAAALPFPFSYIFIALSTISVLVPDADVV